MQPASERYHLRDLNASFFSPNEQSRTAEKLWSSSLDVKCNYYEMLQGLGGWSL